MTKLLIQHGPAKGQKIGQALEKNNADGVIFSLRDENIDSILSFIETCKKLNENNSFIDPQFYYSTFENVDLKNLEGVMNYPSNVSRRDIRTNSDNIVNYLNGYYSFISDRFLNIITPGFCIESFDWKFDSTLDNYKLFKEKNHDKSCYISLLISSKMFHSKNDTEELLMDIIDETGNYTHNGIYLIIKYDETADINYESIDSETLSNILYFIYYLKQKDFKIIVGYSFINSILFTMCDCDFVASGWFNNLRKFTSSRFDNVDMFGRRKKKYFSKALLSYINLETISQIKQYRNVEELKSNTECDDLAFNNPDDVSFVDLEHQFWQVEHDLILEINKIEKIEDKIKFVKEKIMNAIKLSEDIINSIPVDYIELRSLIKNNTSHLSEWLFAIDLFIKKASILIY